jgi:hypothetical protein
VFYLALVGDDLAQLINLTNGGYANKPVLINDPDDISNSEWEEICKGLGPMTPLQSFNVKSIYS